MSTMGRPSSYSPDLCELAHNYCLLGATNDELAEFFGGSPRTPSSSRVKEQITGGKGGKGGNLQSLGNSGFFDDGATRRKPGGNWRKPLVPVEVRPMSSVVSRGVTPALERSACPERSRRKGPHGMSASTSVAIGMRSFAALRMT